MMANNALERAVIGRRAPLWREMAVCVAAQLGR